MITKSKLTILFLSIVLPALSQEYKKVSLTLDVPMTGLLSVSICDAGVVGSDTCNADGLTELLLCSEVKGRTEQPGHYLGNDNTRTRSDLDLLLLTQGYRHYDVNKVIDGEYPTIVHSIEETQLVSGYVTTARSSHPKNIRLTVFNPKTLQYTNYNLGDSSRFVLKDLDFADGDEVIIEATKSSGSGSDVYLHIDSDCFPRLHAVQDRSTIPRRGTGVEADAATPNTDEQDIYDVIELPDVEVKGEKRYRNRRGVADRSLMEGDGMFERLPDVQSMLRWLGIQLRYNENGEPYFGKMAVTLIGKEFILTPIYIDDILSDQEELWHIEPSNIAQVEYLTPNNPMNVIYSSDAVNSGCLLVYMKDGAGRKTARTQKPNMAYLKTLGYQLPAEFHAHVGDSTDTSMPETTMPLTTLYWSPKVRTDENGEAVIRFNSPGGERKYLVSIEGTLSDGTHISKQIIKEVGR